MRAHAPDNNKLQLTSGGLSRAARAFIESPLALNLVFYELNPEGLILGKDRGSTNYGVGKGHAALLPDAGFSNSRAAVARVQRSNSTAMERASDRIIRAPTSASCPLHASTERASSVSGSRLSCDGRGQRQRRKDRVWRSGAGVVDCWLDLARSRERGVVEQTVEADEAGARTELRRLTLCYRGFRLVSVTARG